MLHRASPCNCEKEIGMSKAHIPQYCEHGALFQYVHGLTRSKPNTSPSPARKPRKPMKRVEKKRDWSDARAKVEEEGALCRVCGGNQDVQAAHIIGRERDKFDLDGERRYLKARDRIWEALGYEWWPTDPIETAARDAKARENSQLPKSAPEEAA